MASTWIGISGWKYPGWRGVFYPPGLLQRRELEYASRCFNSIELNGSFYSLQRPDSYRRWHAETPDNFCFAVKGSRFITHNKKLGDAQIPLANFFASGVLRLGEKLGPILWQLAPTLHFREERVASFFEQLPRTQGEAVELGKRHDFRVNGRSWLEADGARPLRHALEPRHESFSVPAFTELCRRHGIAIVTSDSADWPTMNEITADFLYLRLHGSRQTYASRYTDEELDRWAERVRRWRHGRKDASSPTSADAGRVRDGPERDVYIYFDNDAKVHAPEDARRLAARLQKSDGRRPEGHR